MSARLRGGLLGTVGVAIVATLAALAVAAYRDRPAAGLELGSGRAVSVHVRPRAVVTDRPCGALPKAIRRGAVPIAFLTDGALRTIDLRTCVQRTLLASGAKAPVRVSPDGRWVGSGAGLVISRTGGETQRPLGDAIWRDPGRSTWAWAPSGDVLAGITVHGAIMLGKPAVGTVMDRPPGWGATSIAFDGPRRIAVVRGSRELWTLPVYGGRPRLVTIAPGVSTVLQLITVANGSALAWRQPFLSASVQADGDALVRIDLRTGRITTLVRSVVVAPGFVVPCGPGVAVLAGYGRDTTGGKRIVVFNRRWRPRFVGVGVSPSCSANGRTIAFATGRREPSLSFGEERRAIDVVRLGGRPRMIAPAPARGSGADAPILSADGTVVEWVAADQDQIRRGGPVIDGALHAALTTPPIHRTGPIAALGRASDYYGTLSWPQTVSPLPRG